jgi:NAD(P)-dependent dehydrogenase (short-subunit alcohol dehydrogenase family)
MTNAFLDELFSLQGRVALVTGASGGIGRTLAAGLARAGAVVAISGRNPDRLASLEAEIAEAGGSAVAIDADVSDAAQVTQLAERALDKLGRVDILVNCAGMNRRMPMLEVTQAVYDEIMDTNLRSAFFLAQALAPQMAERGGGKIINIGSLTVSLALQNVAIYGMSKSALAQLTRTQAVEWAASNIQANCLAPGFIRTELTGPLFEHPTRSRWMLDRIPLKRGGKPADLVGMAIYLASPASDYTTGQTIYVDGGFTIGSQWD